MNKSTEKLVHQLRAISSDAIVRHMLGTVCDTISEAANKLEELSPQKPLSNKDIKRLQEKHFTPEYVVRLSDELALSWYKLGLRDGEKAHGIGE